MRKKLGIGILCLLVVVLAGAGWLTYEKHVKRDVDDRYLETSEKGDVTREEWKYICIRTVCCFDGNEGHRAEKSTDVFTNREKSYGSTVHFTCRRKKAAYKKADAPGADTQTVQTGFKKIACAVFRGFSEKRL